MTVCACERHWQLLVLYFSLADSSQGIIVKIDLPWFSLVQLELFYVTPSTFEGYTVMGSWKGRGNLYIQLIKVLYNKLPVLSKQLPTFPLMGWAEIQTFSS